MRRGTEAERWPQMQRKILLLVELFRKALLPCVLGWSGSLGGHSYDSSATLNLWGLRDAGWERDDLLSAGSYVCREKFARLLFRLLVF